jgi:catecholate siderophore receptor
MTDVVRVNGAANYQSQGEKQQSQRPAVKAPRTLRPTIVGLALSGLALPALAQTPPAPATAPTEQLPTLPVGADRVPGDYRVDRSANPKLPSPVLDTPRSLTIIPKELIKDQGATTLQDALRTTPGISFGTAEGGVGLGDRIYIRGFDARGDIFVDGMRDPGAQSRESFNIEQIEINKGPASSYSGRGSTGGSVNIITKAPRPTNFYTGDVTFGTDGTKRTTADVNQVVNEWLGFRVAAMFHDGGVGGRDAVFSRRWGVAPSIKIGGKGPTTFTLSYYHLTSEGLPDYGIPFDPRTQQPLNVRRNAYYGLVNRDFLFNKADVVTGLFEHEFNESLKFRMQLRYGSTLNNYVASAPETPNPVAGTINSNAKNRNAHNTLFAGQADITWKFNTGFAKHTVVGGFEITRERVVNSPYTVTPTAVVNNYYDPNPYLPWTGTIVPAGTYTQFTTNTKAAYVFDTVKLSEQWEITGGLRLDNFETVSASNIAASNGLRTQSTLLNWAASVVYKPMPNGSIYITTSSSSNPSGEQSDGGADFGGLAATSNNLPPERNYSYEIGTKWDILKEQLSLTGALFLTDKTNARVTVPGGAVQAISGKQRVYGVELGATGKITEDWSVFAGFTWLRSRVESSPNPADVGKQLPNVPELTGSIWTTYRINPKFTVGGLIYYIGRRSGGTFTSTAASIPAYWRFDAMATYKVLENVDFRFNLLNITNVANFDSIYRSATPFAYIGPGRTALFTVSARW